MVSIALVSYVISAFVLHGFPISSFKLRHGHFLEPAPWLFPYIYSLQMYAQLVVALKYHHFHWDSTLDLSAWERTVHEAVATVLSCKFLIHADKRFLSFCCPRRPLCLGLERANAGLTATSSDLLPPTPSVQCSTRACAALSTCLHVSLRN